MQGYMPGLPNAMHSLAFLKVIDDLWRSVCQGYINAEFPENGGQTGLSRCNGWLTHASMQEGITAAFLANIWAVTLSIAATAWSSNWTASYLVSLLSAFTHT